MTKRIVLATILFLSIMSVFTGCAGSDDSAKTETVKLKDLHTPDADELKQMVDGLDKCFRKLLYAGRRKSTRNIPIYERNRGVIAHA